MTAFEVMTEGVRLYRSKCRRVTHGRSYGGNALATWSSCADVRWPACCPSTGSGRAVRPFKCSPGFALCCPALERADIVRAL